MAANVSASEAADWVWPEDAVEVGRIVGAFGVKGWIKVQPFSSDPQSLFCSRRWFLKAPEAPVRLQAAPALPGRLRVKQVRGQGNCIVAAAEESSDRNAAEALRGARVFVSRASFPSVHADEFYWVDLIGLAVVNREGEALGTVAGLLDTGAHSVLRVCPPDGRGDERLIPFVAAYVDDVSLSDRRIVVDWGSDY